MEKGNGLATLVVAVDSAGATAVILAVPRYFSPVDSVAVVASGGPCLYQTLVVTAVVAQEDASSTALAYRANDVATTAA